jgi:hypothetical protein
MDQHRANRRKSIKGLGVEELPTGLLGELEEAAGEVIPDGITQNT